MLRSRDIDLQDEEMCLVHTRPSAKASLQGVDQRVSSLATESASEVIQSQTPHHTSTETVLLKPLDLQSA